MFCCEGYVFTHVMLSLTIPCVSFYLVWNSNCQTIIFEVGSLLIKEGTMCSAAMCTFPIHSVKHPITLWNQLLKDPELKYEFLVLFSHPFWVPTLIEVPFSFDIIWGSHSCWEHFPNDKACCCSIFPCASLSWFSGLFLVLFEKPIDEFLTERIIEVCHIPSRW